MFRYTLKIHYINILETKFHCQHTAYKIICNMNNFYINYIKYVLAIELAQAVDIIMVQARKNLHFNDQSKQFFFLSFVMVFSKRNRKHVVHVSSGYRNIQ